MKSKLARRAAKNRLKNPHKWLSDYLGERHGKQSRTKAKPEWRDVDETTALEPAPTASGWVVLMVEPRMEAKAATALRDAGYVAWFPQTVEEIKTERRGQRIKRRVNRPLFPRYLFAAAGEAAERFAWPTRDECRAIAQRASSGLFSEHIKGTVERIGMLDCDHVSAIIGPVPVAMLADLSARQGDGEFVKEDEPAKQFGPGAKVRVTDGVWSSFDGVVERSAKDRIRILLDIFGRPTPVEVGIEQVEAA